ncbi:MAG: Crp/Fnr family transcriptional regulator [Spirochaetales bacterium]
MPKAIKYTKGSIIYFADDEDGRIFVLQKGLVILTSTDVETHESVIEHIREGEFFGVKSALGRFPREETATVITETVAIVFSVQEFEKMFSGNKQVIMKMLKTFSNQLRAVHRKTESLLKSDVTGDQVSGMIAVAQSFFDDDQYKACCDVCMKLLSRFPTTTKKEEVAKLYGNAQRRLNMQKNRGRSTVADMEMSGDNGSDTASAALKQFSLPAFARFAKKFEQESVIIAEYEPGDCFYLIQSGQVQLVKCVKGSKKNLDILKPSEFFGEMAILENSPRSATAVALTDVEVLEFNKENFGILIMGNPQIALILLKLFCKRIYDQKRRLRILVINDLQARVADVFLMFDEMNKGQYGSDKSRRFNLTVQDLSHWAGIPVDAARDEINKFVEKRKIDVFDTYMVINNIMDMRRIVDTRTSARA